MHPSSLGEPSELSQFVGRRCRLCHLFFKLARSLHYYSSIFVRSFVLNSKLASACFAMAGELFEVSLLLAKQQLTLVVPLKVFPALYGIRPLDPAALSVLWGLEVKHRMLAMLTVRLS